MTKFKLIFALSALIFTATASAMLEQLEDAMELTLSSVTLPGNDVGNLTINACEGCETVVLKASKETRYIVRTAAGDTEMARSAFSRAARSAGRTNKDVFIGVFYRPESKIVSRIVMIAD